METMAESGGVELLSAATTVPLSRSPSQSHRAGRRLPTWRWCLHNTTLAVAARVRCPGDRPKALKGLSRLWHCDARHIGSQNVPWYSGAMLWFHLDPRCAVIP